MRRAKNPFPIATAFRDGLRHYNRHILKDDLIAGFIVSLIALPLAMALAIAVGLPPRHGLYTAIVAGIAAAIFGGSKMQVSGPTAAFVVILAPIVSDYGVHGLIWCQILAGVMLLMMGMARFGKLIHYVPYPVIMGFTAGIAVVIGTLALDNFLGLGIGTLQGDYLEKLLTIITHLPSLKPQEAVVGAITLLTIIYFPRLKTKAPSPIVGIALGTVLALIFNKYGFPVDTLYTEFSYESANGVLKHGIQPYAPTLHLPVFDPGSLFSIPDYAEFKQLLGPAMVVAALAALESLLAATVADTIAGTKHNPNAELNGIGIANIFSGLAAGIPATGALARTATNIHAGAKTPMAAIFHSLFILLYVVTLARWISYIPMSALAALLLTTAYRMSHIRQFMRTIDIAPKGDVIVLLGCFLMTVFIDMVAGVTVGMILATLLFMKHISESTRSRVTSPQQGTDRRSHRRKLPPDAMIYHIEGPLFFGSVDHALEQAEVIDKHVKKLILDVTRVPLIDMTGMVAMQEFLSVVACEGCEVVICGDKKITRKIMQKISGIPAAKYARAASSIDEAF